MRIQVLALLASAGAFTGALGGWVAGGLWRASPLPEATGELAVAVLTVTVILEAVGRPRPPSVRRQVPQEWGRLFPPRTVAVLYGARLGVGPATILPTWFWWGAFVVAAACGPWVAAAAGAVFAVVRVAVTHGAVIGVRDGGAMSRRITAVRRLDRPLAVVLALAVLALGLAGCAGGDDTRDRPATTLRLEPTTSSTTTTSPPGSTSSVPVTPEVEALDDTLLDETLPGFQRNDEAVGAGLLDLEAAARAESDVDAERALLETRGFVRGASRAWTGPDDDVVYLAAYEFASADGAAAYLTDGAQNLDARGATRFEVPGVEGAIGFTTVEPGFTGHAVTFTRGPRWFLVLLGSPEAKRTPEEAIALAGRQASG